MTITKWEGHFGLHKAQLSSLLQVKVSNYGNKLKLNFME